MDDISQKKLDGILQKDVSAITDADASFLRARSSYLNKEQKEKFADMLEENLSQSQSPSPSYSLTPSISPTPSPSPEDEEAPMLSKMSYKELVDKARERGVKLGRRVKREELLHIIEETYTI